MSSFELLKVLLLREARVSRYPFQQSGKRKAETRKRKTRGELDKPKWIAWPQDWTSTDVCWKLLKSKVSGTSWHWGVGIGAKNILVPRTNRAQRRIVYLW